MTGGPTWEITFFLLMTIISNILFGIIIDKFAELRQEKQVRGSRFCAWRETDLHACLCDCH